MSLDFTVPGAIEAQPEEPVAPEIPPTPLAPAAPVRPPLPAALEEAATMYAAGQELEAMRRLETAIKTGEDLGDAAVRAWGCLFELLQVLDAEDPRAALLQVRRGTPDDEGLVSDLHVTSNRVQA